MAVSSWVESVEFIDATITSPGTSVSYELSKGQNYENCVPFFTVYASQDYWDSRLTDVYFSGTTESGIINFKRWDDRGNHNYIKCYVVEFNPEQVRVQQGTFDVTSASTDTVTLGTTLSGVDRAAMTFGWKADNGAQEPRALFVRGRVLSTTQIDFYRNSTSSNCNGHWFLFEDLADNFRVTHHASSFSSGGQTLTIDSGRTVDPLRMFILGSHAANSSSAGAANRWSTRIFLYSDGSIRADKSDGTYHTIYWAAQVVEFLDKTKVYTPFDHYTNGWTTPTTASRVVGGTSTRVPYLCNPETTSIATAMMQGLARGTSSSAAQINNLMVASELTASGTITFTKSGSDYVAYPSYTMAVDWAGIPTGCEDGYNDNIIPEGAGAGESFVKSVENFRFTLEDHFGAYPLTKGQDWENCAVFASHRCTSGDYVREHMANIYIVEPGIICIKSWDTTGQVYVDVSVVEFWPNQIKVQHKNVYTEGTQTTNWTLEELSSVNKAFVLSKNFTPANSYQSRYSFTRVRFTSETNLEIYKNVSGYEHDVSYFVVEDLQNNFVTRHHTVSWADGNESFWNGDVSWDYHRTMIIHSYASSGSSDSPNRNFTRTYWHSEYRPIYSDKSDGTYHTIYSAFTAVRFLANKRVSQLSNYTMQGATNVLNYNYTTDFSEHPHALSIFPVNQSSTGRSDTSATAGVSEAFFSVRFTDYDTRAYEIAKTGGGYNAYGGFQVIDWIGCHYQDKFGYTGVPTRSLVGSLQKRQYTGTGGTLIEPLKYGQDVTKCVPFFNWSFATAADPIRDTVAIYRYEDPDFFTVRFGSGGTADRRMMLYIVEFNQDIKVQHGYCFSTSTSATVTIEEVNLDRAFLHFYSRGDDWEDANRRLAICGHFVDSTTLQFDRTTTGGSFQVSWYVVECPEEGDDSHWIVQRDYRTGLGAGGSVYGYLPYNPAYDRTMYMCSWTTTNSNQPARGFYRMFKREATTVQFDKSDGSYYNMNNLNIEAVEFNKKWQYKGMRVSPDHVTLSTTVPVSNNISGPTETGFFTPRTMLIGGNENNNARVNTSSTAGYKEGGHYYEFEDPDEDGFATSYLAYKTGASYTTYSMCFAIQWPEFNKYFFEGYVTEQGDPVPREVLAYRSSTGEIVDRAMSVSGTGYFHLETPYYDEHHVVCFDDEPGFDYNHLIYGRVFPTAISGSFAYQKGITVTSGIDEDTPVWEEYE